MSTPRSNADLDTVPRCRRVLFVPGRLFINYLLRPQVAAKNASTVSYATGVEGSEALLPADLRNDQAVYPPTAVRQRLRAMRAKSPEFTRAMMRAWTRFKTGQ